LDILIFVTTEESTILTKEINHLNDHSDRGHRHWGRTPQKENEDTQVLIAASRDRTILIWKLNNDSKTSINFVKPVKSKALQDTHTSSAIWPWPITITICSLHLGIAPYISGTSAPAILLNVSWKNSHQKSSFLHHFQ